MPLCCAVARCAFRCARCPCAATRRRAGFSSCALACCKRRLNISCRRSRLLAANSTSVMSLISANFITIQLARLMPRNKFRFDRQLRRRQAHGFARHRFRHAVHFKQHVRRTDHGHPGFERRLALAHSGFQRLLREGLLREDANPHFAVALHVAGDRHARGLDLLGVHPATFQRHQSVFAERDRVAARRQCPCGCRGASCETSLLLVALP